MIQLADSGPPKTAAERQRARRERMRQAGMTNCSVYAHPQDHAAIKAFARELSKKRWGEIK